MKTLSDADAAIVVAFLVDVRTAHVRRHGVNMKIYEQVQSRVEEACLSTSTMRAWCTRVCERMQIGTSKAVDRAILDLCELAMVDGRAGRRIIRQIKKEVGYLIALLRLAVEEAREARKQVELFDQGGEE